MSPSKTRFNPWMMCLYVLLAVELMAVAALPKPSRSEIRNSLLGAPPVTPVGPWYFKCTGCGYELTIMEFGEYRALLASVETPEDEVVMEPVALDCPECGHSSFHQAEYCPHCTLMYVPSLATDPYSDDASDHCPQCGFSPSEERARRWRMQKQAQGPDDVRPVVRAAE